MFIKRKQIKSISSTVPLLRYWTWRFTLLLLILLIGFGLLGISWIRESAMNQQFAVLEARAELLASYYSKAKDEQRHIKTMPADQTGQISDEPVAPITAIPVTPAIPKDVYVQIFDFASGSISTEGQKLPDGLSQKTDFPKAMAAERTKEVISADHNKWFRVGMPLYYNNQYAGKYYVSMGVDNSFERTYILILAAIGLIALCGWMVVYLLSRSLTKPLRQLAHAAGQISGGNYRPELPDSAQIKEAEIYQLVHSFDDMSARLEQLERLRTDLLASVSHELRTPVTSIRGMIQAVKDGVVTGSEAEEFMQICMNESKRLQTMVNELLDFSAMETDQIHASKEKVELSLLIGEVITQLQTMTKFAALDLIAELPSSDITCIGDPTHLKQILFNLISNSAAAGAKQIKIKASREEGIIRIDISDNGKGIPAEEAPFIFERYYRGDSRRKKKQGMGLGLPICQLLAKANDGKVELLQSAPSGTIFRIHLKASNT